MSVISNILYQIRHAIYGRDVREAIASGIEQCYEDSTANAQIARIVEKGQETYDSIPEDYSTLTGEVSDLKSAFTDNFNHLKQTDTGDPAFTWELGTFVASSGAELSDNQYLRTVGKLAIDSIRNLTIVNNTGKKMRVGMYLYNGSTFVERVGGQNFEIAVDGSYTYDLTNKNGVVRLTWYYTVKETMQTSYSDNLDFSYETAIISTRRRAFIAERGTVQSGDNANDYKMPGSYNRSSSLDYETDLTNFPPTNESAQLHVLSYGNTLYQLYQTATNLYFRRGTGSWLSIKGMIDDSIQYAFMANAGSLVADFDANTLKIPGSFLKSSSVNVTNLPTQETGIVLDFTNNTNNPCHVEITGTGKLFYRFGTAKKWVMGNASNDYNNRLFNKKMIGLGDSLLYGQGLTPEERESSTWFALLASQYGMTAYKYAHSGSSIAYDPSDVDPAMCVTIDTIITEHGNEDIDYFVLEGGANDTSNAIELGELTRSNETKTTFYGALNYIISQIKSTWPKCRILLMTNYDRKVRTSPISGYTDEYYVNAMVDFAHFRGIPVFDNYHDLGVSIRDYYDWSTSTYLDNWFFPIASGQHISVEGYAWIAPIYAKKLESI